MVHIFSLSYSFWPNYKKELIKVISIKHQSISFALFYNLIYWIEGNYSKESSNFWTKKKTRKLSRTWSTKRVHHHKTTANCIERLPNIFQKFLKSLHSNSLDCLIIWYVCYESIYSNLQWKGFRNTNQNFNASTPAIILLSMENLWQLLMMIPYSWRRSIGNWSEQRTEGLQIAIYERVLAMNTQLFFKKKSLKTLFSDTHNSSLRKK